MEGFKSLLITGACGFIGYHLVKRLATLGFEIIGLDNINDYYDLDLKYARLNNQGVYKDEIKYAEIKQSKTFDNYRFIKLNLEDKENLDILFEKNKIDCIIHLAAQAGVRYSIENPYAYINSNLIGFMNILEACRYNPIKHLYYASSSSVYGKNNKVPFSEKDNVDNPVSLYAATKKSNELLAAAYHNLYSLSCTGLRFFTVYGPWGRPDMAYYSFTDNILKGKAINVFNYGDLMRDFTYIDDIIESIYLLFQKDKISRTIVNRILNIGNNKSENLLDFISILENELGIEAKKQYMPMQQGDVYETYANIDELKKITGYSPKTNLKLGISNFIKWYRVYYSIK